MARISTEKFFSAIEWLKRASAFIIGVRDKLVSAVKSVLYWSAVGVVGFSIATFIMHAMGVPVFETVEAVTAGQSLAILIANILYYGWIGPYGILLVALAYVLQIIINYPHGDFWVALNSQDVAVGYVNVEAVIVGWKLVRDICNIFFSIILVIIALGTVLKIEAYSWKKLLPKFIVMAIMINFSKSIAGVFTDVATVAMATFGGSFGNSFAVGLLGAFNITGLTEFNPFADSQKYEQVSATSIVGSFLAAAIMMLVFGIIITILVAVFFARIVMLWFLIVLSPLAYVTRILPATDKFSSKWWSMFGNWVMVGPIMTFMLWLTLTMAYGVNTGNPLSTEAFNDEASVISQARINLETPVSGFQATSTSQLATFLVGTVMLLGSMTLVKQMASEAGSVIGKAEGLGRAAFGNAIKGASARRLTAGFGRTAAAAGDWAASEGKDGNKWAIGGAAQGLGNFINYASTLTAGTAFSPTELVSNIGGAIKGYGESRQDKFEKQYSKMSGKLFQGAADMTGKGGVSGALGVLGQAVTAAAVVGGKGGQSAFDSTFTIPGLVSTAGRVLNGKGITDLKSQEQSQKELIKDLEGGLHQTKFDDLMSRRSSLGAVQGTLATKQAALNNKDSKLVDIAADTSDGVFINAVADARQKMEEKAKSFDKRASNTDSKRNKDIYTNQAASIRAQIAELDKQMQLKGDAAPKNLEELNTRLAAAGNGKTATENLQKEAMKAIRDSMKQGYGSRLDDVNKSLASVNTQLVDENGNIPERSSLLNLKDEKAELRKMQQQIRKRSRWNMPANLEGRVAANKAVRESTDKFSEMSKNELLTQLTGAIQSQSSSDGIAALKLLSGKYGGIKSVMNELGGSVDSEGAVEMAKKLQKGLDMKPQAVYQLMDSVIEKSGLAHLAGVFSEGDDGYIMRDPSAANTPEERADMIKAANAEAIATMKGIGATKLAKEHGLSAFVSEKEGAQKLTAAGLETLLAGSHSWAETKAFDRLSDSFKAELIKSGKVIDDLAASSRVNRKFMEKLKAYDSKLRIS